MQDKEVTSDPALTALSALSLCNHQQQSLTTPAPLRSPHEQSAKYVGDEISRIMNAAAEKANKYLESVVQVCVCARAISCSNT